MSAKGAAAFGALDEAREIQALIASRLSIPTSDAELDVSLGGGPMARMVIGTSTFLIGAMIGWIVVLVRDAGDVESLVRLWLVTAGALAILRAGVGRRAR